MATNVQTTLLCIPVGCKEGFRAVVAAVGMGQLFLGHFNRLTKYCAVYVAATLKLLSYNISNSKAETWLPLYRPAK